MFLSRLRSVTAAAVSDQSQVSGCDSSAGITEGRRAAVGLQAGNMQS